MSCPHCHAEVADADVYCISCGARLQFVEQASPSGHQPPTNAGPDQADDASILTVTTGARHRGRRWRVVVLAVMLNLVLLAASAWMVYAALVRYSSRSQGLPSLGAPRLVRVSPATAAAPAPASDASPASQAESERAPSKLATGGSSRAPAHGKKSASSASTPTGNRPVAASRPVEATRSTPASRPAGANPAPSAPASSEPISDTEQVRAGLEAESVRMVVQHHLPQLRLCSDRVLKQQSKLSGLVEIQFEVDTEGRVRSASVYRNTTGHDGLGKCIATKLRGWRFPRPVGGEVVFIYPFLFSAEE